MSRAAPQEWRVHIGAHKTATTHLQHVLSALAPELDSPSLRILPTESFRHVPRLAAKQGRLGRNRLTRSLALRRKAAPVLRQAAGKAATIAYSEEDFLGWTTDLLAARFYQNLSGLELLPLLAGRGKLKVFLSVRSYDRLLPSAVFQCLHVRPDALSLLEPTVDALLAGGSGWPDLFDRIAEKLPGREITFWTQESYAQSARPIVSAFLGREVDLPDLPRPASTSSPSPKALEDIARLDPGQPMAEWRKRVEEIYARHPAAPGERAELIPAKQAEALKDLYARHLDILRDRYQEIGCP